MPVVAVIDGATVEGQIYHTGERQSRLEPGNRSSTSSNRSGTSLHYVPSPNALHFIGMAGGMQGPFVLRNAETAVKSAPGRARSKPRNEQQTEPRTK